MDQNRHFNNGLLDWESSIIELTSAAAAYASAVHKDTTTSCLLFKALEGMHALMCELRDARASVGSSKEMPNDCARRMKKAVDVQKEWMSTDAGVSSDTQNKLRNKALKMRQSNAQDQMEAVETAVGGLKHLASSLNSLERAAHLCHKLGRTKTADILLDTIQQVRCNVQCRLQSRFLTWYFDTTYFNNDVKLHNNVLKDTSHIIEWGRKLRVLCAQDSYNGTNKQNLAVNLIEWGFTAAITSVNQHVWIHPDGIIVRVKRTKQDKPKSHPLSKSKFRSSGEFTMGYTAKMPLHFDQSGVPILQWYAQSDGNVTTYLPVAYDRHNEIAKLGMDRCGLVWVIPSSHSCKDSWRTSPQKCAQVLGIEALGLAHFPLKTINLHDADEFLRAEKVISEDFGK